MSKLGKRSTVKIEQISVTTGDIIHIWANAEAAAATLLFPLPRLRQILKGEYDDEFGDEVGGFRWRYALAGAKVTAGASSTRGGGGKKAQMAWLEFRDKLYDPNEPHIYKDGHRLRDYQVDGVNWLASTWYKKQGCILADEVRILMPCCCFCCVALRSYHDSCLAECFAVLFIVVKCISIYFFSYCILIFISFACLQMGLGKVSCCAVFCFVSIQSECISVDLI
jgi:hypothetical protein